MFAESDKKLDPLPKQKGDLSFCAGFPLHIFTIYVKISRQISRAVIAQMVEHVHGKDGVPGSIPGHGSRKTHLFDKDLLFFVN